MPRENVHNVFLHLNYTGARIKKETTDVNFFNLFKGIPFETTQFTMDWKMIARRNTLFILIVCKSSGEVDWSQLHGAIEGEIWLLENGVKDVQKILNTMSTVFSRNRQYPQLFKKLALCNIPLCSISFPVRTCYCPPKPPPPPHIFASPFTLWRLHVSKMEGHAKLWR
jgi:hypothetical protein